MKILHVLYAGLGGHGNVFFSLVTADQAHEFEYEALFNGVEKLRSEYIKKCHELDIPWDYIKKKPGFDLTYYNLLLNRIKKSKPDIIFLHSSAYILPARLANLFSRRKGKIIIRETQANDLKSKFEWIWLAISFLFADRIIFLSYSYKAEVKKRIRWFYKKSKVAVIPNGINLNAFCPSKQISQDQFIIGMQSRLVKIKDHETLLKAFALIYANKSAVGKSVRLKIAGDGDTKTKLQQNAIELGIAGAVEFTGMLDEDELISFLQSLNIYIHASFGETMSTSIMQAMACGLPVIATDVKGINNMVTNGENGLLVPPKDEQRLANLVIRCIEDRDFTSTLATNGLQYARENFSNDKMFNLYKQLFLDNSSI